MGLTEPEGAYHADLIRDVEGAYSKGAAEGRAPAGGDP